MSSVKWLEAGIATPGAEDMMAARIAQPVIPVMHTF